MPDTGDGVLRALGRLEGKVGSLEDTFRDERSVARGEHEKIRVQLEMLEGKVMEMLDKSNSMQSQIYSNKHGIEGVNKDVDWLTRDMSAIKILYARGLGAWAVISGLAGIVASGAIWALLHLTEVGAALRVLFVGKA